MEVSPSRIYGDPMFWQYAMQSNPPIHIVVENGRVRLTGVVNSEIKRREAEIVDRSTFGTFEVNDKLKLDSEMPSIR